MLPRNNRLTQSEDFRKVFRKGRASGGTYVVLHWLRGSDSSDDPQLRESACETTRIGFIASKKVGNAVMRHRVKRQLRHLMRERLGEFPAGARVVVRSLPAAAGVSSKDLAEDLDGVISRGLKRVGSR
ncbi:ribonuclease P protein component [Bowdeniella massiliensis]|uniref:ribonuclease P protein component n=1 Tax=Bowdeniella massiliensis TaxID=2932264 RepID=UPI003D6D1505